METSIDANKPTLPNNSRTDNEEKNDQKSDLNDGPNKEEKAKKMSLKKLRKCLIL